LTALAGAVGPASGASAAASPPATTYTFPVPTRVLPGGIAPGTPRVDWDLCDKPGALGGDTDTFNKYEFSVFYFSSLKALQDEYLYEPGAPADPYQPWPAYVTCTVTGPMTVPSLRTTFRYAATITNVSGETVSVAYVTSPPRLLSPNMDYQTWAHARWVSLGPGQSHVYTTSLLKFVRRKFVFGGVQWALNTYSFHGYWLVRPSAFAARNYAPAAPKYGFTEWVDAFQVGLGAMYNPARPSGQCNMSLVPGTVDGIASAPNGGYWVLASDGEVVACDAPVYGDLASDLASSWPPNYIATGPRGYWVANGLGEIIPFGGAQYLGQFNGNAMFDPRNGGLVDDVEITGFAAAPSGQGYWLLTAYGRVLAYHAPWYGSANFAGATVCRASDNQPCTLTMQGRAVLTPRAAAGIAPTDGGKGYVIVARDGVTRLFGRGPDCPLPAGVSVAGVAADYRTGGYWVATTHGQVYACRAPTYPYKAVRGTVAGIAALPDGLGYRLATTAGTVWDFGAATFHGDPN
jgi:hypothetical protein